MTYLRRIERFVIVALFLGMVALFFANVVIREVFPAYASQMAWSEEAVRRANTVMVFLSLGLTLEAGRHIAVDTFRDRLPSALRMPLLKLIDITGLVFSLYMSWLAWGLSMFVLGTGQRSPTLGVEIGWLYLAPMVGFLLLAMRYALSLTGRLDRFTRTDEVA
ncbi:TRAP transporter small permease [Paracoccus albus]|uniref:TRAP transporter small permease n=1 Tax=Paracoccus albus TaxID=3017784 RepID=UPI0022F0229C|nr:TRAP transporter small permease subunit [Paracoccus albus]WBU62038.1 TRAP transporter small permease subunit [Paracoccus albus]